MRLKFRPTDRDLHPAVIVSNDEYCADPRILRVNVLHGTKVAPGNPARAHQVLLNSAEGLDLLTAIDCGYVYGVNKDDIVADVGMVGIERRRALKTEDHRSFAPALTERCWGCFDLGGQLLTRRCLVPGNRGPRGQPFLAIFSTSPSCAFFKGKKASRVFSARNSLLL